MKDPRSSSSLSLSEYLSSLQDYSDPARRLALFAAFPPSRDVNPHSWDAKLAFWSDLLLNCARSGLLNPNSILTLNANDLPQLLAVDGLRPLGLGTVLYQLHQSQKILPVAQVANLHAQSWLSWTLSTVIVTPLQWSLRQIGLTSNVDSDHEHQTIIDGEFVVMPLIKEISEQILHKHQSDSHYRTDHLLALSDFSSSYSTVTLQPNKPHLLSKSDLKLILSYMEYAGHVVTVPDGHHEMLIKFKAAAEKSASQFTPIDRNILTLKTTISNLHSQSTLLESKLSELTTKIKSYLAANAKTRALLYLKSKKQLEKVLNDRLNSLSTLENALLKIQTCETEKEIIQTYTLSTQTLTHLLSDPTLSLTHINKTIDSLDSILQDSNEVSETIQLGMDSLNSTNEVIDDDELEKELEKLVLEQQKEMNQEQEQEHKQTSENDAEIDDETEKLIQEMKKLQVPSSQVSESDDFVTPSKPPVKQSTKSKEKQPQRIEIQY